MTLQEFEDKLSDLITAARIDLSGDDIITALETAKMIIEEEQ